MKESQMKALVVYDSQYGNTEQIARAIARGIGGEKEVVAIKASEASADTAGLDLLVVGSPTQGGRPTPPVQQFLAKLPSGGLKGVKVAAFDTRAKSWFTKLFGYAAARIAAILKSKGGTVAGPEQAFYVKGTKGPLVEEEIDRAMNWGKELAGRK
jgi:flavodoxin I